MQLRAFPSKPYVVILAMFACGIAEVFFFAPPGIPAFVKWIMPAIAAMTLFGTIKSLVSGKPVLTADESGIHDRRFGSTVIAWGQILAFRHAPRVKEAGRDEKISHFLRRGSRSSSGSMLPRKRFFGPRYPLGPIRGSDPGTCARGTGNPGGDWHGGKTFYGARLTRYANETQRRKNGWYGVALEVTSDEVDQLIELLKQIKADPEQLFHLSSDYKGAGGIGDLGKLDKALREKLPRSCVSQ